MFLKPTRQADVVFTKLRDDAFPPIRATQAAAAYDLCAADPVTLTSNKSYTVVNTGLKVQMPPGCVGLVCSRSGLAAKFGVFVLNAPGIIDPDYEGELKVILARHEFNADWPALEPITFNPGDRVAQFLILSRPLLFTDGATFAKTTRLDGGLGSTGIGA